MLKIRPFIIALAFAPLITLAWQLTNQAQTNSPSKGTAGSASGGGTTGSGGTVFTSPSKGTAGSASGGGTPGSSGTVFTSPSKGTAGSASGGGNTGSDNNPVSSPSKGTAGSASGGGNTGSDNKESGIIVKQEPDGSIKIKLSAEVVNKLNAAANRIFANGGGQKFSSAHVDKMMRYLTSTGVSPKLSTEFTRVLGAIFLKLQGASTTPSSLSVRLPQEQLIASLKASKASLNISEANEAVTVNVDKLNEAINIYNKIVLESDPATLQQLARNSDFVEIGKALTELRIALK